MKEKKTTIIGIFSCILMILFILDAETIVSGAKDGVELCLYTVVPSLFPFLILSTIITTSLTGKVFPLFRPIGRLCGIGNGNESLLILGLIGGYPVGAQSIATAFRSGRLQKDEALRMLGFCNNAGPAFIFGITSHYFSSNWIPWLLWGTHILSAIIVGFILPRSKTSHCITSVVTEIKIPQVINQNIKTMGSICAWVISFRVLLSFCQRWFLWLFPPEVLVIFSGIMELSNGCSKLHILSSEAMRFLLCSIMLSFGGISVFMQTVSVTQDLGTGMYLYGKIFQSIIGFYLCYSLVPVYFGNNAVYIPFIIHIAVLLSMILTFIAVYKKSSRKAEKCVV